MDNELYNSMKARIDKAKEDGATAVTVNPSHPINVLTDALDALAAEGYTIIWKGSGFELQWTDSPALPQLMAFWKYDRFPFLLCGTVVEFRGCNVVTAEYGQGYQFTPTFILPLEQGKCLKAALEKLQQELSAEMEEVHQKYKAARNTLLYKYGQGQAAK